MQEVTDTALQRLYWACRGGTGFPGDVPDELTGTVTTMDILKGLGLVESEFNEFNLPKNIDRPLSAVNNATGAVHHFWGIKTRGSEDSEDRQSILSLRSTTSSPQPSIEQVLNINSDYSMSEATTSSEEPDTKTQFVAFPGGEKPTHTGMNVDDHFFGSAEIFAKPQHQDLNAFLDISSYTPPSTGPPSLDNNSYRPRVYHSFPPTLTTQLSLGQSQQPVPAPLHPMFPSTWPEY